ncbi:phosphatase PAP2 family protein [Dankookia rubra]|nr:phosphatase PAP2 family protein [Dankookia rubra]
MKFLGRSEASIDEIDVFGGRLDLRHLLVWCLLWIVVSAVIYACVVTVDHPLALLIRDRTDPAAAAILLVRLPEAIAGIAIAGAAALGVWRTLTGQLPGVRREAFLACLGICVALAIKSELKLVFGRVPPEAWFWHQSGPLRNFHLFYAGSFPSGHMTVLAVLIPFIWAYALPFRGLWLLLCAAVGCALMIMEAHFLGDLVAGALLGVTVGAACRHISRT